MALIGRSLSAVSNQAKLTGRLSWSAAILAPAKDLLQAAIWALSFLNNEITWRGERFRVDKGGKLTPIA
jgi:hypothetical protein